MSTNAAPPEGAGPHASTRPGRVGQRTTARTVARNNEGWVSDLGGGAAQRSALDDLRDVLLKRLRRALSGRPHADEAFLEDMAQDALLRILERLDQFEGRSRFLTWATAIAVRTAMTELRRRRWQDVSLNQITEDADRFAPQAAGSGETDSTNEQKEILETLHRLIETDLTDKQRTALLAELRGMPQSQIAQLLGSNRNAVYKLTHDARKRLRRGLEARGVRADDVQAAFSS